MRINLLANSYRAVHLLLLKISSQDLAAVLGWAPNSLRKVKGTKERKSFSRNKLKKLKKGLKLKIVAIN